MKMYFENELGRVDLFFGGSGSVRVTGVTGLGNAEEEYKTVSFAGRDGHRTLSKTACPRTIVISGDLKMANREEMLKFFKVLGLSGELVLDFNDRKRKIFCNQVKLADGVRKGIFMNFVLTLVADEPYFTDMERIEWSAYDREKLIKNTIIFPCIFSRKTTETTAMNNGDLPTDPVIYIYNIGKEDLPGRKDGILIENKTSGQKIQLITETEENEKITIDIPKRKITSSLRGNIISLISDDTFLNDFQLFPGENKINVSVFNEGETVNVVCSSKNLYREGIY